jgi:hypothetical protein
MGESDSYGSKFKIQKKDTGESFYVGFDLRYYLSDLGGDNYPNSDNSPSGTYLFKPDKNHPDSMTYSKMVEIHFY